MATPIPKNQAPFSLAELQLATGGVLARAGSQPSFAGVTTDSRGVVRGEVFVALRGEKFDGHDHAAGAVEHGAGALVVERDVDVGPAVAIVRVVDGLQALASLARFHRQRWALEGSRRVVGITGSAGKTTTRHVVEQLLAFAGGSVHSSAGNLNNAIGVPMTLFGLTEAHDVAVVEMGMNQPGEIAHLARMALPDVGVVTLVAEAHTAGVGSIEAVAHEKGELLAGLSPIGCAIANGDDPWARAGLVRSSAARKLVYGECEDADVRLLSRAARGLSGSEVRIEVRRAAGAAQTFELMLPLLGRAGVYASLAAIATLAALEPERPADRFASAVAQLAQLAAGEGGRLAARECVDGTIVIDDAYNANPASMIASIEAAQEIAKALERRLVLVLGPMFELGDESDALHERVGRRAAAARPSRVVVVASEPLAHAAATAGADVVRVSDAARAENAALEAVSPGDVVLVKASNSVGLSRVARRLLENVP